MNKKKEKINDNKNNSDLNDEEEQDELKLKNLAEELKAIVKEVQWYKYWGKKKELENMAY